MKDFIFFGLVLVSIILLGYFLGINNIGYGGWATPRPGEIEYEANARHRQFWLRLIGWKAP